MNHDLWKQKHRYLRHFFNTFFEYLLYLGIRSLGKVIRSAIGNFQGIFIIYIKLLRMLRGWGNIFTMYEEMGQHFLDQCYILFSSCTLFHLLFIWKALQRNSCYKWACQSLHWKHLKIKNYEMSLIQGDVIQSFILEQILF